MAEDKTDALEGNDIQQPAAVPETPADPETPQAPEPPAAPEAQEVPEEEDILTDPMEMTICPGCQAEIDTSEVPPFTEIACPACGAAIRTEAKFGAFRLLRKLGSGGMGSVFLGQDDALNRKTAIKVVKRSLGANPNTMEAFQREAQATAKLNHPNIVQIYAFGEEKGQPYIAMEFVGGGSLDGLIEKKVRMDPAFVLRVGKEIAQGLGAALEAGLIHGDVKPENILFDENYRAKLVDFGIASALSANVNAKEIWGTPYYIAPEKARGKKADIRSDLYSLGATLYHALTLHPPFDGPDARAVVAARFTTAPAPIGRFRPDIDRKAVEIIERMLHPNPMMRFPNVNALVSAIDEFLKTVSPASRADKPASGLPTGAHPRITGVRMQAVSAATGAAEPAAAPETAPGGKKKIVISKSRRSLNVPSADAGLPDSAEASGDFPVQPPMDIPPPKPRGNPVKGCLIAFFVLLGVIVLGAIGTIGWFVQRNAKAKAENERRLAAAKQIDTEVDEINARVAAAAAPILKADAEAEKILKDIASTVSKATEFDWPVPDIDPKEPILIDPAKPEAPKSDSPAPEAEAPAPAAPKTLKDIKDDPVFADGKNAAARKALIAFAMDKANAAVVADPAAVEKVLAVVRDPENAKDADVMEIAVKTALEEVKTAAAPKADAPAADGDAAAPAGDPLAGALDAMAGAVATAAEGGEVPAGLAEGMANMLAQGLAKAIGDSMAQAFSGDPNATATITSMGVNPAALAAANPFAQKADKLLDPARRIRRARREAEARRDREMPMFTALKGDNMTEAQYQERVRFKATRERDEKALHDLLPSVQEALKELRRHRQQLERESRPLLEAIQARQAAAEKDRLEAEAKAKAQREADERKAKIQQEIDEAQSYVSGVEEFIRVFDYDRAISVLAPCKGSYAAEEANAVIQNALDRLEYLAGLRRFILTDLHEGGGLSWGLINRDIVDADPETGTITARGGATAEISKADLRVWMNLIDKLVVSRDPKREHLSQSQHGDLLYGSAIFCIVHGNGNEAATKRAIDYARKARVLRETVTLAIPRLTPELKDALEDQF